MFSPYNMSQIDFEITRSAVKFDLYFYIMYISFVQLCILFVEEI